MDITQAKLILSQVIASRSDEVIALQLAASILNSTYKAEFDSLTSAKEEADRLASELNTAKSDKTAAEASFVSEQASHASDIATLATERDTAVQALSDATHAKEVIAPVQTVPLAETPM